MMLKLNEKSEQLRNEGNQLYARRNFHDALIKYNESLCLAENESENLGFAFANKSAVYFEMKMFEKCLRNIDLAFENKYPESNKKVLETRQNKCKQFMQKGIDEMNPITFFKDYQIENNSGIANCLEVKFNEKFGRHLITNKPLKVGDVIVVEKPFCKVLHEEFIFQRCGYCFKDNFMDLIPCLNCCKVMFCSNDCRQEAMRSFHSYECPLMNVIYTSILTSTMRIALRTFFYGLSIFEDSIEDFSQFILENEKTSSSLLTIFNGEEKITDQSEKLKLLMIHSLVSDCKTPMNDSIFNEIFHASQNLRKLWISHGDFIRKFLIKQTKIATMNYHEIYNWPLKLRNLDTCDPSMAYKRGVVEVGNGSYSFNSLVNHSCAANVNRIFCDDKIILIVQRSIDEGEQIFNNYGYDFTHVRRDYRQNELMKQYNFICQCIACKNNFPSFAEMKIFDKSLFNQAKKFCRELKSSLVNQKKSKQLYKEIITILRSHQKNFPCVEICSLMESLNAFLELIMKPKLQFP